MRRYLYLSLIVLLLAGLLTLPLSKAQAAGSVTGADMIALMNSWRSGYFSNALIESSALDQCAQSTAEEMERIGAWDHLANIGYPSASVRCESFGFVGHVTENWATDARMSIDLLSSYWADSSHMLPATDQQYGYVGVGISGNYYVLQAGSGTSSGTAVNSNTSTIATSDGSTAVIENTVNAFPTSTPDLDGTIWHVVKANDTLYTIAINYGTTIGAIKTLNNLTSDQIVPGNILKISLKPTPTITPTRTPTVMMPTRTRTATLVPTTPSPTQTSTPTPTPTKVSVFQKIDRQYLGFGLMVFSAVGFFVVIFFFFIRPRFKKS
jgi:LysM repeat protein